MPLGSVQGVENIGFEEPQTSTKVLDEKSTSICEYIDRLEKHICDQDEKFTELQKQFQSMQDTLRQFAPMRDTLKQQTTLIQQQASKITDLEYKLCKLQVSKVTNESSSTNLFLELSIEELLERIELHQKKVDFFKSKGSIDHELYKEESRLLRFVAINAISALAPGIVLSSAISGILQGDSRHYLSSLLEADQFGQCYIPSCIDFIKKGAGSINPYLSFLYNTISYKGRFKHLRMRLMSNTISDEEAAKSLMRIICRYGLDIYYTSIIEPTDFNDTEISDGYVEFLSKKIKRISDVSEKVKYKNSFGSWPFGKHVSVAVDANGYPGYYLTGLFINHFSDSDKPVMRMQIDSKEEVELELTQLREALKSKKKLIS